MLVRRTQDPEYWRGFSPTSDDIEYVRSLIIESGRPVSVQDLSRAVVYRRVHRERERIRELMERGRFYRPSEAYEPGQELIFPALDFATGVVQSVRPGHWPGHGEFDVIKVRFDGGEREFAARFSEPHRLNASPERLGGEDEQLSPEAVYERFGGLVPEKLEQALAADESRGFVEYDKRWFLRELMPAVHIGYLNLAEAVIEVAWESGDQAGEGQRPLNTDEILAQVELQGSFPREVARFALDLALSRDERFIDVGNQDEHLWLLRRLIPPFMLEVPARLRYEPVQFSVEAIPTETLNLIWGVADELSTLSTAAENDSAGPESVEFVLTYPHRRAGTLPLTPNLGRLLPQRPDGLSVVTFVDEANSESFVAWISHSRRYIASLAEWYDRHQIPAGAYIALARTAKPGVFRISYRSKRRTQREYVRVNVVQGDHLAFEIRRQPMSVEFDETMVMVDDDSEATDALWRQMANNPRPLSELLLGLFPGLAKLSPQGTVHFNTLYTAVNVLRRCPPEPILAELSLDWRYVGVGNGYYAMDERVAV